MLATQFIVLDVPDAVLLERCRGRRVDPVTNDIYHTAFYPPPEAVASRCVTLATDSDKGMGNALEIFHKNNSGVLALYKTSTHHLNGDQPLGDATTQAWALLCSAKAGIAAFTPRVLLLGPPGAGCFTQAALLATKFDLVNVSTGNLIRQEISKNSKDGQVIIGSTCTISAFLLLVCC